ncbi:GNAT family N-acetyltransferase [Gordonia soli]|nr:GNAT family N-acetyltransferase [Gordonia soli]
MWTREIDPTVPQWAGNAEFSAAVDRWMTHPDRTVWIASEYSTAAGMVCMTEHTRMPRPRAAFSSRWGYLGHLYVRPEFRLRGIGYRLLVNTVQIAEQRGYSKVMLSPTPQSIPVYLRAGFTLDNDTMILTMETGAR